MGDDLLHPGGAASLDEDEVPFAEVIAEKVGGGCVGLEVHVHLETGGAFIDKDGARRHGDKGVDAVRDDTDYVHEGEYFGDSIRRDDLGVDPAIRALLRKLVAAEAPGKPLSDHKLADVLAQQGIKVARRTIAKYREALGIPPSSERKRLA